MANINVRPWAVELLQDLLKERGLPWELQVGNERYAFEKKELDTRTREEILSEREQLNLLDIVRERERLGLPPDITDADKNEAQRR